MHCDRFGLPAFLLLTFAVCAYSQQLANLEVEFAPYRTEPHRPLPGRIEIVGDPPTQAGDLIVIRLSLDKVERPGQVDYHLFLQQQLPVQFTGFVLRGPVSCGSVATPCTLAVGVNPWNGNQFFSVADLLRSQRIVANANLPRLIAGEYALAAVFREMSFQGDKGHVVGRWIEPPQYRVSNVLEFHLAPRDSIEERVLAQRLSAMLGKDAVGYEEYETQRNALLQLSALESPEAVALALSRARPTLHSDLTIAFQRLPDPSVACAILGRHFAAPESLVSGPLGDAKQQLCGRAQEQAGAPGAPVEDAFTAFVKRIERNPQDTEAIRAALSALDMESASPAGGKGPHPLRGLFVRLLVAHFRELDPGVQAYVLDRDTTWAKLRNDIPAALLEKTAREHATPIGKCIEGTASIPASAGKRAETALLRLAEIELSRARAVLSRWIDDRSLMVNYDILAAIPFDRSPISDAEILDLLGSPPEYTCGRRIEAENLAAFFLEKGHIEELRRAARRHSPVGCSVGVLHYLLRTDVFTAAQILREEPDTAPNWASSCRKVAVAYGMTLPWSPVLEDFLISNLRGAPAHMTGQVAEILSERGMQRAKHALRDSFLAIHAASENNEDVSSDLRNRADRTQADLLRRFAQATNWWTTAQELNELAPLCSGPACRSTARDLLRRSGPPLEADIVHFGPPNRGTFSASIGPISRIEDEKEFLRRLRQVPQKGELIVRFGSSLLPADHERFIDDWKQRLTAEGFRVTMRGPANP